MSGQYRKKRGGRAGQRNRTTKASSASFVRENVMKQDPGAGDGVVVNGYSERWLRRGFPWVYREEVVGRTGRFKPGHVVSIRSRDGAVLGTGIWDDAHVEVRRFRDDIGPIDSQLLSKRIGAARDRRPLPRDTTAWRWIHGENDALPGIRADVWGSHIGLCLDSPSLVPLLEPMLQAFSDHAPDMKSVWLSYRIPDGEDARFEGLPSGMVWGEASDAPIEVLERGVKVAVEPWLGHDVGLYCDMRELRAWMEPHWKGKRVLNTFAHTGMFSVAAARHGAREVVSVDLSERYLERARQNFQLNGLDPARHIFDSRDTFKVLDARRRRGDKFDVVIADPPSFSHSKDGRWSAKTDFPRLVAASLRVLAPGGWLIVASNQGKVSPKEFLQRIQQGAHKARRPLRLLHEASTPVDFPAALDFPESRYLKAWVLAG
jgi:23S rRNA (cytosine1962-C5)-methyltransferase